MRRALDASAYSSNTAFISIATPGPLAGSNEVLVIDNNAITTNASSEVIIQIGAVITTATRLALNNAVDAQTYKLSSIAIGRNTLINTSIMGGALHFAPVGTVPMIDIGFNFFKVGGGTGTHAIEIEANNAHIHNNVSVGVLSFMAGGDNIELDHNTAYSPSAAIWGGTPGGTSWEVPKGLYVHNNISIETGNVFPDYALSDYAYNGSIYSNMDWRVDNNDYYATNGGLLADLNKLQCTSVLQMQNVWSTNTLNGSGSTPYDVSYSSNDANSLNINPNFVDPTATTFSGWLPQNSAMALPGGEYMGAIAPNLSSDASLFTLTVSTGTLSPSFASSTTSYTVVLPHGTVSAPTVTATTDDPNATDTITQASSPTGSATVLVTAQDNITTSTYSISFAVAPTPLSITSFSLAATSTSLTVPIVFLTTSGTVAEYFFNELSTTPSSTNSQWLNAIPASYTFQQAGLSRTLYAWVKDGSGNVSSPASATVSFPYYAMPSGNSVQTLVSSGIVTSTASSVASTTAITFSYPVQVSVGASVVSIPSGTTFTTASSSDFTQIVATTTVATDNLPSNSGVLGTIQYGLASSSISLNQLVTITIPVDPSYDGQSLPVYQSENGGVSWTQLTTCTITSGVCSFTTSNLSSFAVVVPTVVSTPSTPGVVVATGGGGSAYDIYIDNGVATATSSNVTLSLYGTGAYTMELSNNSSFASSTWIPYVTSMPWALTSSTGEQTVFVQYRAVSGSIVGSAQASIDLTTAPGQTIVSAPSTAGMSVSQMQNLLASLEAQLQALQAKASGTASFTFTRNLSLWSTGNDVKQLQLFLISQNSGIAAAKLSKHGTTNVFGMLTFNALVEFQKKASITPASGYFGPITRAYVNDHP